MESRRLQRVNLAIDFIEGHLHERLSLDGAAAAAHYSKYHLHRLFTEAAGMTLYSYMVRRRLTEGARRLVFSEYPVLDVALSCGYESQQAFTLAFREMYKLPPARYRERGKFYPLQLRLRLTEYPAEEKLVPEDVRLAAEEDIPSWMELLRLTVDGYPCLDEADYLEWLKDCVAGRAEKAGICGEGGADRVRLSYTAICTAGGGDRCGRTGK